MVSSGGELVAIRCSGPAYIPNHPQKVQVGMATPGDTPPTKVQVTKPAPMLRQNQKRERAAAVFFCRLVQNVQVHVLLGHQLPVWLIVRGATNSTAGTDKGEVGPTFLTNFISAASLNLQVILSTLFDQNPSKTHWQL